MTKHDWGLFVLIIASQAVWTFLGRLYLHWRGKIHKCSCGDEHKRSGE